MSNRKMILLAAGAIFCFLLTALIQWKQNSVQAQSLQEVTPYKFADLPHGRIYKAVHEGCELFITEYDYETSAMGTQFGYSLAIGRCK